MFDGLADRVDQLPHLYADAMAAAFSAFSIGAALSHCDAASIQAKSVLKGRFQEISSLCDYSANSYSQSDTDAAQRIAAIGDLNVPGQPGDTGPGALDPVQPGTAGRAAQVHPRDPGTGRH